jgi:hypothetical protein
MVVGDLLEPGDVYRVTETDASSSFSGRYAARCGSRSGQFAIHPLAAK